MNSWKNKRILITGVAGTIGSELLSQLAKMPVEEIIGIDTNESELFFLSEKYRDSKFIRFYIGDVKDRGNLFRKMEGVDVVLHAAALKHVYLCEESPADAVQTNIIGTQNIIDAAIANNVGRVIFTSSDKAVNPTNVMGTSKLMGERLMTAANALCRGQGPIFASTRFGNVLGSRGSVVPLFKKQILSGSPVTITHNDMTRFVMTVPDAARLVLDSVFLAKGGEVFVTKMPVIRILDLAHVMIEELAGSNKSKTPIRVIGVKSGEKMYEELISSEETRRTLEMERFFIVLPAFKSVYKSIVYRYKGIIKEVIDKPYLSTVDRAMNRKVLKSYLKSNRVLED